MAWPCAVLASGQLKGSEDHERLKVILSLLSSATVHKYSWVQRRACARRPQGAGKCPVTQGQLSGGDDHANSRPVEARNREYLNTV